MDGDTDAVGQVVERLGGSVPRRAFLVGAGAAIVATACGRGTQRAERTAQPTDEQQLSLVPASAELAVGDERVAFAIFRGGKPIPYTRGASGQVAAKTPAGRELKATKLRTFPIVRSTGGEDAERQTERGDLIFVARLPLAEAGAWPLLARVEVDGRPRFVTGGVQVLPKSRTVAVGGKAIAVGTPTTSNARGVEPICTRTPECTMHDVSLDEALANGKPTVVTFATPALCESRMCGPDVDVVEEVHLRRRDDANFVHVEIYKDQRGRAFAPGTAAWSIDKAGEPWVFFVSSDGVVRDRLSGPIGEWEVDEAVERLVSG